ncbi:MAG TPA: hypothetical protein VHU88_18650 [Sporichthyaceae bacterium]|jgi:hypothetical protein|nr:hypothetical protein [Sporichthyaceae bacterium]
MRLSKPAGVFVLAVALTTGGFVGGARAVDAAPGGTPAPPSTGSDITSLPENGTYRLSPQLAAMLGTGTLDSAGLAKLRAAARPELSGDKTPPVGTTLLWPAIDVAHGIPPGIYLKPYTLHAVGKHVEVWVASGCDAVSCGTHFPAGDCRDRDVPGTTDVTEPQIKHLVDEFDNNMYPKETAAFSTPPDHNGSATIPGLAAAGLDFSGDGDHTVALIDNVRQPNFYDFPKNQTYIAGFFAPVFNQITDRNVITVDAYDWVHRTGANPSDNPSADLCRSRPAHPFTYESVFGHEWQHLLEHYQNPNQATWVNEGLSMFAEALDGYTDTRRGITQTNAQPQLLCFQGYGPVKGPSNPNPRACGGPAESLTLWGDQGASDPILANYGNAWSFMLYCFDRFGLPFMSALHRDGTDVGLADVQTQLDKFAPGTKVGDLLHQFQLMNLVDHYAKHGKVTGIDRSLVTAKDLDATLNLANPAAVGADGTAPNGADYLQLATGSALQFAFTGNDKVNAAKADPNDPTSALGGGGTPPTVDGWYVSLVGIDPKHNRVLVTSHSGSTWKPDAATLARYRSYPQVVAVIAHDDPTDSDSNTEQHAGYSVQGDAKAMGSDENFNHR